MDGSSTKKSSSFETLVIQNISNVNELKAKLNEILTAGKSYDRDVSSCLKSLIKNREEDIVLLTVQVVSEIAKSQEKRDIYACKDIIEPMLSFLHKDITSGTTELIKHSCRALGNLCCDCDTARNIILEGDGIAVLVNLIEKMFHENNVPIEDLRVFTSKMLLNFAIGGQIYCEALVQHGLINQILKMLTLELQKNDMNDDIVSTALLILSVISENRPEILFEPEVNTAVLNVLEESANVEISELCLEHLHSQAEHDSVKTLLANLKGVQLVCQRLELLVQQYEIGDVNADDTEVESVMKQACDLIIIILTGDEAMHILYDKGNGETYSTMVKWLDSTNHHLLITAILAIGNFARQDDYCANIMDDNIFDKLLDIFETYHKHGLTIRKKPENDHPVNQAIVTKIQHAVLSAIRNLIVPVANKRQAALKGRAAPILLNALPTVEDHYVAYKMLAAIRMLVDGQAEVAAQLACHSAALGAVARWGHAGEYGGAAGEAPRLLAWTAKQLRHTPHWTHLVQVEGCISSLVSMLVVCHSVMQNEAILALTLLGLAAVESPPPDDGTDYEKSYILQLIASEIGKHVAVLIDTNCAKMPLEVAENLLAFLDLTSKKNKIALDYKEARIHDSLQKFMDARTDLSENLKRCITNVITTVSDRNGLMDVE